jgi:hypothetical protein
MKHALCDALRDRLKFREEQGNQEIDGGHVDCILQRYLTCKLRWFSELIEDEYRVRSTGTWHEDEEEDVLSCTKAEGRQTRT